ncbi:hypothetical protein EV653_4050 [Kribbella pratensis]|uniref:Uncharacterized protein n=1 Tax=Kribbella pratensis TaxID=2512112 RepID=A0A4V3GFZ1_9ACTN|nr:hypothetical protein EV653_4050 [Kribbella pratensis]
MFAGGRAGLEAEPVVWAGEAAVVVDLAADVVVDVVVDGFADVVVGVGWLRAWLRSSWVKRGSAMMPMASARRCCTWRVSPKVLRASAIAAMVASWRITAPAGALA